MAGDSSWKKDASGIEHPVHSILLAFIRGQCPEHEKRIQAHLSLCDQCSQVYAGLSQSSKTLNSLKQMSRYLSYPELTPELVLTRASLRSARTGQLRQGRQGREQETNFVGTRFVASSRKVSLRIASLPVAFVVIALFMAAMFVLVYALVNISKFPANKQYPSGSPVINSQNVNGVAPQQTTPTATVIVSPTLTGAGVVSPTPNGSATSSPKIYDCTQSTDLKQRRIVICGANFIAGDRVVLVVDAPGYKQPTTIPLRPSIASKLGIFQISWNINSCRYVPTAIYAKDLTTKQDINPPLTQFIMKGCSAPTFTP